MSVETGDMAPAINLPCDDGSLFDLAGWQGDFLIVFFYPKADTSGCTKEAIGFSQKLADFRAQYGKVDIMGISKDPVIKLQKFREKHDLTVMLASDQESDVVERYGCWVEKSMYGRKYMGIERSTFVINSQKKIVHMWRKVKIPGHIDAVYDVLAK